MKVLHKTEENTEHGLHKCIASRLRGLAMSGQTSSKPCTTTELSFSMQHPTCFLLPKDKNFMACLKTTLASVCNSLSLATPNPHRNPKQCSRNLYGQNYGWLPLCEVVERSWMHNFCHIIISTATTPNRNLCHEEHPFAGNICSRHIRIRDLKIQQNFARKSAKGLQKWQHTCNLYRVAYVCMYIQYVSTIPRIHIQVYVYWKECINKSVANQLQCLETCSFNMLEKWDCGWPPLIVPPEKYFEFLGNKTAWILFNQPCWQFCVDSKVGGVAYKK